MSVQLGFAVSMVQRHVQDFCTGHLLQRSCLRPVNCDGSFYKADNQIILWDPTLLAIVWLPSIGIHWVCYVTYLEV